MNYDKLMATLKLDSSNFNDDEKHLLYNSYTRYRLLRQAKLHNNPKTNHFAQDFQNRLVTNIEANFRVFSYKEIFETKKTEDLLGAGVYLIYLKDKSGNVVLTYVGESKNIWVRWKTHLKDINPKTSTKRKRLYSKLKKLFREQKLNYENVQFVKIVDQSDANQRLFSEAYFIYNFKSPVINANNKNLNSRAACTSGHGRMASCLTYQIREKEVIPVVQFRCRNQECRIKFEIF
ncbi:hypothetical protein SSABA_v1c01930 [Spiroplasma sabaudiense Ar-1343]|uniref:GIY-YIG domain-containing protein n=2 Tax=Spiroplasma sabaudiense TaxID=216944 RepID=W6A9P3_9MOLU|nr:hypothetical protein SSABA_v1c01930 [Spiroplasma sabaudiense Ar-1343]